MGFHFIVKRAIHLDESLVVESDKTFPYLVVKESRHRQINSKYKPADHEADNLARISKTGFVDVQKAR